MSIHLERGYKYGCYFTGTFGPDGTSVNIWWVQQDETFQAGIVNQFAVIMAQQIASGDAE